MNNLWSYFLFGLSASLLFGDAQAALEGEGIIGGENASLGDYPYQISLEVDSGSICGGCLIDSKHVITAAHCVTDNFGNIRRRAMKVVAGISELGTYPASRVSADVDKVIVHKLYDTKNFNEHLTGDIAVLRLRQSVDIKNNPYLDTVKLPIAGQSYAGKRVVISGFGWTTINMKKNPLTGALEENGGTRTGQLKWAESDVITKGECQKTYRSPILESHICAKVVQRSIKPEGICSGDSGGPLIYSGDVLVGVVSTSPIGCREDKSAAVYTRVSYFLDFIDKALKDTYDPNAKTLVL